MRQTVLKADREQHRQENRRGYALLSHTTYLQVHDEIPVLFASDIRNRTDEASFAQPMLNPFGHTDAANQGGQILLVSD